MNQNKEIHGVYTSPLGDKVVYYKHTDNHILESHIEMEGELPNIVEEVIENPDYIRKGRHEKTKVYVKIETYDSNCEMSGIFVCTIEEKRETADELVTTAFRGKNGKKNNGNILWNKNNAKKKQ